MIFPYEIMQYGGIRDNYTNDSLFVYGLCAFSYYYCVTDSHLIWKSTIHIRF